MLLGVVHAGDGDAFFQLVTPGLGKPLDGDVRGLHWVGKREGEGLGGHTLVDGHTALVRSQVVLFLAPAIGSRRASGQGKDHQGDDAGQDQPNPPMPGALAFALLQVLLVDGIGHIWIVGIGRV